ncbi:hypothetical protein SPF06_04515 [Sinomonas sp. JGH33]|uniref:SRPBCC family protein n=1 Tax=Sinomonas terricola TaxID=3110330 RepID=A0ABU5T339_9MICC|nr:hypothetical protein [Sinomonas sp. JGH33]MEA5453980.1 hypothetical protein [Sinomonas sp. JGH33]
MATSRPTRGHLTRFELKLKTPLPPPEAWARILDLRAHDRLIPFTHITHGMAPAEELQPGHRFVACTTLGRVGFNDIMTVEEISPPAPGSPGHVFIVKSGKLIRGFVDLTVEYGRTVGHGREGTSDGATVRWVQEFGLGRFPAAVGLVASWIAPVAYRAMLHRLLRG